MRADAPPAPSRTPTARPRRVKGGATAAIVVDLRARADAAGASAALSRERDLGAAYGVGRATIRGVIRELERQGVARMARGRHGGLYVADLYVSQPARRLSDYLTLTEASLGDVANFAMWLHRLAARLAAAMPDAGDALTGALARSRSPLDRASNIDRWCAMRLALVTATGNGALAFFYSAALAAYRDALSAELNLGPLEASRTRALWPREQAVIGAAAAGLVERADHGLLAPAPRWRRIMSGRRWPGGSSAPRCGRRRSTGEARRL